MRWKKPAIALGVFLFAGAAALAVVHLPRIQRIAFTFAAARARLWAGTSIQASDFRFNLFLGTAEIRNLVVRSTADEDLPPLTTIGTTSLRFNPLRLPRGLSACSNVQIRNFSVQAVVARDGRTNLPKLESSAPFDWNSLPSWLELEEGSFRYEDLQRGLRLELPRLQLALKGKDGGRELDLSLREPGQLAFEERRLTVDEIRLLGKLVSPDLEIHSLTAKLPGFSAEGNGWVRNLSAPSIDISLKSTLKPGGLLKFLGREDPPDGVVAVDATLTGPLKRLTANAVLDARDIRLTGLEPWSGKATLRYDLSGSRLSLKELSANSLMGSLTASGSISLGENPGGSALKFGARGLDTYRLMTWFGWTPAITGLASGTADIMWDGTDWRSARLALDVNVTQRESGPSSRAVPLGGSLKLERDPRRLALHFAGVQGPGFHLDGDLAFDRIAKRLRGQFAGEISDGAAVLAGARRLWPSATADFDVPVRGSVRWNAQVAGPPSGPRVTALVESASLRIGRISDVGLAGTVEYDAGLWRFLDIDVSWRGQKGRLSGAIDTNAPGSPTLGFEGGFEDAALAALLTPLDLKVPITGRLSARLKAQGTLAVPVAEGTLKCEEFRAIEESFGKIDAEFRLNGTELSVGSLHLEKPQEHGNGTLEASGSLDWEKDSLAFRVEGAGLRLDSMTLPDGTRIRGVFSLGADGETSLSEPAWKAHIGGVDLSVAERKVGVVRGSLAAQGGRAMFSLDLPDLPATVQGEGSLKDPYSVEAAAESAGIDFRRLGLPSIRDIPIEGSIAGRITAAGPLSRPREMTANGRLQDLAVRFAEHEIRGAQAIGVEWKEGTLTVVPATLAAGDVSLRIGGSIPLSESGTGEGLSVEGALPITLLPHLVPGLSETEAKGTIQIRGLMGGSLDNLAPSLEITGRDGELRIPELKTPLTRIAADVSISPDAIEVRRLEAKVAEGSISAKARIPFSTLSKEASGTMTGTVELSKIDLRTLIEIPGDLTGSISLKAEVEAPRPEMSLLRGTVRFQELSLRAGKTEAGQSGETLLQVGDGRASIDHFVLRGPQVAIEARGSVSLLEDRALDLKIDGTSDAQLLAAFGGRFNATGNVDLKLGIGGTVVEPLLSGGVDLKNGRFILTTPPIVAEGFQGHAEFSGSQATLTGLSGRLNGGQVTAEARFAFDRDGIKDLRAKASATNLFLDYPKGLRTASNFDLEAHSEGTSFVIGGTAQIVGGEHREAINLQTLKTSPSSAAGPNPLLERIRLNIQVRTTSPLSVDNNLARVDAYVNLRLAGTASRPALLGRLELDEGGRVYISERVFSVTRAVINFTNENAIEPTLDLQAQTRIAEYTVTIHATGGLKDLEASFTSDPAATEDQIYSLLLTGSVNNTDKISSGSLSSRQALSLFGSSMMGSFNMRVRRALGVSDFRIEPSLISPDSDPTARLTIGQNLTPELRLTYSTNLQNSNDQIWIGEYDWRHKIVGRYVSQTEDTDRGELRHKLRFGGGDATGDIRSIRRTKSLRLASFDIEGELALPRKEVLKKLKLKEGQKYDFINVQKRLEELTRFYAKKGYLEMTVRQERERDERAARLKLIIDAGRPVEFEFNGANMPKNVRERVAAAWQEGVIDAQRLPAASALVRRHLIRERFCDATVEPRIEARGDASKKVVFEIVPGPRYERVGLTFEGPRSGLAKDLRASLRKADLDTESEADPEAVQREVTRYLEGLGYLSADVARPRVDRKPEARSYESIIKVNIGPRYKLGSLQFEGNSGPSSAALAKALAVKPGDRYIPARRDELTRTLQEFYWRKGYRDAAIELAEQRQVEQGTIDLRFRIKEERLSVIAGIQVEGNVKTSEAFLRRRISLKEGDPADGDKLDRIRRRLFNSGTYSMGDLTLQPPPDNTKAPPGEVSAAQSSHRPVDLKVKVREPKPFSLDYGVTYDTSRGAGALVDFSNRNILGEGRYLGYRVLVDRQELNQRVYFSQPFLGRKDVNTTLDVTREESHIEDLSIVKQSITLQQLIEFRKRFTFSYGYRFRSADSTFGFDRGDIRISATTSPIISALSRDTRDDVFDATRGSYTSHATEFATTALGGNLAYSRYFGQYFKYFGLTRPDKVAFSEVARPRFVFATGIRLGLLRSRGDSSVTPAERFFGGGGSTIRGFAQNELGPKLPGGQPVGGQALLFLNNEIRSPLYKLFDAAAFADIGNVWPHVSDFSLADLRKTAGIGIRIRNPFILVRFDYGWKLDRRPGESAGAFHFSIGQAF